MYKNSRCSNCEKDYDQCPDCYVKDKEAEEYERNHKLCAESGNKILEKYCKLKATGVKIDSCSVCGYQYIYP